MQVLFPATVDSEERKKLAARITRLPCLLRGHSVIEKIQDTHRYRASPPPDAGSFLKAEIGSVEPGRRADLISLDGNAWQDITALCRVGFVMRGGRVYQSPAR